MPCKLFSSSAVWKKFRSKTVRLEISAGRELKATCNDKLEYENIASFPRASKDLGSVEYQQNYNRRMTEFVVKI